MNKTFKRILCVVLAVAITAVGIPFAALASTPDTVNFGILSDIHLFDETAMGTTLENQKEANEILKMNNSSSGLTTALTETAMRNLTKKALDGEIDFLLIPGDLTRNAEYTAHTRLAGMFKEFEETTGVPVYVIVGNHDVNNGRAMYYDGEEFITAKAHPELRDELDTTPEEFEEIYKDFGYSQEGDAYYSRYKDAGNSEGSLSYATDINDEFRLIAIDSQKYSADNTDSGESEQETAGSISEEQLKWIIDECEKAKKDGKTIIGMCHTNVVPHLETENDLFDNFVLRNWEELADNLADSGMHFVATGHVHKQDVASYVSDNGETITDIASTSIANYPNQFRTCSFTAYADGKQEMTYRTHEVDELEPVVLFGEEQPVPFKNICFDYNFGGDNIKNFVLNLIEYQLRYGFGKDVKDAGGLFNYLGTILDMNALMTDLIGNEILGNVTGTAINALLLSLCNQVENKYLNDIDYTLATVDRIVTKVLDIPVSDYECTKFKDTLGFGSGKAQGTLGDLASTVLTYHYTNDEEPTNDPFLMSALERFDNGQNAETILNTLIDVVLEDLLMDTILNDIKIDPLSLGIYGINTEDALALMDTLSGFVGGEENLTLDLNDVVSFILILGIFEGDTLTDVLNSFLGEYLTQSQYDIIDAEFYRIMKDLTHDENPGPKMDHNGTVVYDGKVATPLSQSNLRLPSHIAVTFGEDSATTRNISYVTKYSLTDTDVQIVPYSENPDFSKGTTVDVTIETDCDVKVERSYPSIDLGFIGIMYHTINVNRHYVYISDLEPDTKYCYRVGDADRGWWSDVGVIDTADNSNELSFFHMTDPQSTTEKQYLNTWASALEVAFGNHDADFILNTGDLVDDGQSFRQWQRMFNTASGTLMNTSMMTVTGNHEEKGDFANVDNFIYANLPEQDTTTGVYYSFDYNNAHFAILNSNNLGEDDGLSQEQIDWLIADMNASDADWKFVAIHKGPYTNGSHYDDDDVIAIREQLKTLMPQLGIDIVFQGHDHVFMRTGVMNDNVVMETETKDISYNGLDYTAKVDPDGTIYSINGTIGVKHYEPKPEEETSKLFPSGETVLYLELPSYSYIQIDGDTLYFDSYAVDGDEEERIDQFAIQKTTILDDETPETPVEPETPDEPNTPDEPVNPDDNEQGNNGNTGDNADGSDADARESIFAYVAMITLVSSAVVFVSVLRKKQKA